MAVEAALIPALRAEPLHVNLAELIFYNARR